jgi:hypothetical protein
MVAFSGCAANPPSARKATLSSGLMFSTVYMSHFQMSAVGQANGESFAP